MKEQSFGIIPIYNLTNSPLFLLIQHNKGHWGFPKGHAEDGETPAQTACREFQEETGIVDFQLQGKVSFSEQYNVMKKNQTVPKTVQYFLATVSDRKVTIQTSEIQDYAWQDYDAARETLTFDRAKKLLDEINHHLQKSLSPKKPS